MPGRKIVLARKLIIGVIFVASIIAVLILLQLNRELETSTWTKDEKKSVSPGILTTLLLLSVCMTGVIMLYWLDQMEGEQENSTWTMAVGTL